ncbi:MarR family transcriptional regulator [Mycobacterium sp.]|uniref:MarR family transcriptional regulator n=1 Tax=Mycobacterium sp. TaxID=1785 RepID=UPI0025D478A7|nr:MarR family transcriptional regulator [Mycobacterium sp.]MBW0014857.1 MarR family transcriptional regulator [Mycobacterium sp.]
MIELDVLQAIRLKGRVSPEDLAPVIDDDASAIAETVARLTDSGLVLDSTTLRLSQEGRARLEELLTAERQAVDLDAIVAAYREFRPVNADFKECVTDWQLKDGQPNTHDDSDYDAAVLARLDDIHQRVIPIVATVAAQIPRLSAYERRLDAAYAKVQRGEAMWLTRPMIDSYHTVWFELHEELIGAAGLTREGEARAGHAS